MMINRVVIRIDSYLITKVININFFIRKILNFKFEGVEV